MIPNELQPDWPCYRLVTEQLATWTEVSTTMSIDDVDKLGIAAVLVDNQVRRPPDVKFGEHAIILTGDTPARTMSAYERIPAVRNVDWERQFFAMKRHC